MRALVTGANGFIGSNLVRALIKRGFRVRAFVKPDSNLKNLEGLDVEIFHGDVRDMDSLERAIRGSDFVFHVAAIYSFRAPRSLLYDVNVKGTVNVMEACMKIKPERIVHTSSVSAVGIPKDRPGREEDEPGPGDLVSEYKRTKYLAELEVRKFAKKGLPVVIVNPSTPIGPYDYKPTPTGEMVLRFLKGKMFAYVDTGLNIVDVEDVAIGHILALERGRTGERYILGNKNMTLKEIFETLSSISGIPSPKFKIPAFIPYLIAVGGMVREKITKKPPSLSLDEVRMMKKRMYFDPSKAVRELGFPHSSVEEAFRKAVRWFREEGYV